MHLTPILATFSNNSGRPKDIYPKPIYLHVSLVSQLCVYMYIQPHMCIKICKK